jgi:hypothetical protein
MTKNKTQIIPEGCPPVPCLLNARIKPNKIYKNNAE